MIKKSLLSLFLCSTSCFISGNNGKDMAVMLLAQNRSSTTRSSDMHHVLSMGQKKAIHSSHKLGTIGVGHNGKQFYVEKDGKQKLVNPYDVDKTLRSIPKEKLPQFFQHGYVSVKQLSNGDYKLMAHIRGEGGGLGGAWVGSTLGYGVVSFAGHSAIFGVSCLAGPLQPAAWATLEQMFAIPIHSAACAGGVAGGMALAVVTGPV